jgi:chromate transporter
LLLEKELVDKRKVLTQSQLKGGVAYAQILPGATQVSIVSNVGYHLRGFPGALLATVSYLLPAISLITIFAAVYFHFAHDSSKLMEHLDGLIAALSGVILANAYKIGSKHTTKTWLWLFVGVAFAAKLWLGINALLIIIAFGAGGLILSWTSARKAIQ